MLADLHRLHNALDTDIQRLNRQSYDWAGIFGDKLSKLEMHYVCASNAAPTLTMSSPTGHTGHQTLAIKAQEAAIAQTLNAISHTLQTIAELLAQAPFFAAHGTPTLLLGQRQIFGNTAQLLMPGTVVQPFGTRWFQRAAIVEHGQLRFACTGAAMLDPEGAVVHDPEDSNATPWPIWSITTKTKVPDHIHVRARTAQQAVAFTACLLNHRLLDPHQGFSLQQLHPNPTGLRDQLLYRCEFATDSPSLQDAP